MTISTNDLNAFHDFAVAKLNNGGVRSMTELAAQWEASRELDDSVAGIRQSMADAEDKRLIPAEEAFEKARNLLRGMK